jgi:Ca2+-transporting ATPase
MEPQEKNIMRRPPRHPQESVFSNGLWQHSVWVGLLTAALTLGTMAWAYFTQHAHWQSMAFTVLTMTQMGHVLAIRSDWESIFRQGFLSNWPLFVAVLFTLVLQLCTLYIPALNTIFKTQPLTFSELFICFVASAGVFVAVELEKFIKRRRLNVK